MATKIKGITIELNADASGIEKALKDVNKSLGTTQRELTSVNKSLKLDPKNLELIEQKQRLLAKATEQTTQKLEALKQAQSKIDTSTAGGQSQYDALAREISDTEQSLKGLNKEQRTFAVEAAKATAASSSFGSSMQKFSNGAALVAEKTKAISAAAGAALAGLTALALKAGEQADQWLTLSQKIGVSTDTLQKFQYASEMINVDMSTIEGAFAKMTATLKSSEASFTKIGVAVRDQNDQLRSTEDIFNDTLRALSKIKNETERDTAAMTIFGKSAKELAGLIDDGGQKLRQLGDEAEKMGLIVSEEDLKALGEFDDMLETIKAQIKAALVNLAIPVMEELRPIVAAVANAVKNVSTALANANPVLLKILTIVLVLIAAISPVASLLSKIGLGMMGLQATIPAVTMAMAQLNAAMAQFLANPMVWTIAAIAVALGLVVYAAYNLITAWDELRASSDSTADAISKIFTEGRGDIVSYASVVVGALNPVSGIFLNIAAGAISGLSTIKDALAKIANTFQSFASKASKFGSDIINAFANGIKSAINSVISVVQKLISTMSNLWSSAERDASTAGSRTANAYINSYNNTSSTARLTAPTASRSPYGAYSSGYGGPSVMGNNTAMVNAINALTYAVNQNNSTSVNVELVGSAKNIFDTVRVQNNKMTTATGYHALA